MAHWETKYFIGFQQELDFSAQRTLKSILCAQFCPQNLGASGVDGVYELTTHLLYITSCSRLFQQTLKGGSRWPSGARSNPAQIL